MTNSLLPKEPFSFNGWSNAQMRIRKQTGVHDWSLHELRRTFATIHASLGTPIHVIEAQLDHSSGSISGVAAIYNRYNYIEEVREAVTTYEEHFFNFLKSG
ncbi:MAG: tyrosine-type recombinase/integrase [Pseudomonadota bacterium]